MHNYWLVVDTLRITQAIKKVTDSFDVKKAMPLYAGTQLSYLNEFSPHVFNVGSEKSVLQVWSALEHFDTSSVMFYVDSEQGADFLVHLQNLLIVNIDRTPTFLRFYTRSFWQAHSMKLTPQDVNTLLGVSSAVYWHENEELKSMSHQSSGTVSEYKLQLTADEGREQ